LLVEDFKEKYLKLKQKGLFDYQISQLFFICDKTLTRYKKSAGLLENNSLSRFSRTGLTEKQLQTGEAIGLTRRLMYQRVRRGWNKWEACKIPNLGRGNLEGWKKKR
jgi:hypothetical protein